MYINIECHFLQIAAIILDNYVRGRYKHIWFSVSNDLKMDAERYASIFICLYSHILYTHTHIFPVTKFLVHWCVIGDGPN